MYIIKYGDNYIHDPRANNCVAVDCALTCEQNSCGYCDFTIYPTNPLYDTVSINDYANFVTVYEDDTIIFQGFIYTIEKDFNCGKTCSCKGDLALLSTVISSPYATYNDDEETYKLLESKPYNWDTDWTSFYYLNSSGTYTKLSSTYAPQWVKNTYYAYVYYAGFETYKSVQYPSDPIEYFEYMITLYNNAVDDNRKITIGNISGSSTKILRFQKPNWTTIWDDLSTYLVGDDGAGGYLRMRYEDGVRYIDYIYDWDTTEGTQIIDFGVNLLDYTMNEGDEDDTFANYIIPYGSQMSSTTYALSTDYERVDFVTEKTLLCKENTGYDATVDDDYYGYFYTLDGPNDDDNFTANKTYYRVSYDREEDPSDSQSDWECMACGVTGDGPNGDNPIVTSTGTGSYVCNSCQSTKIKVPGYKYKIVMEAVGYTSQPSDWGNNYYDRDVYMASSDGYLNLAALRVGYYNKNGTYAGDTETSYYKSKYALMNKASIAKYGEIRMVYEDSSATTYTDLLLSAIQKLHSMTSGENKTISISAVDLHLINQDISPIRVGEYVRIRSKPHDIDAYYICTSIDLDLNTGENSSYTFNGTYSSYTKSQLNKIETLNKKLQSGVTKVSNATSESGVRPATAISITKTDDQITKVTLTYSDDNSKTYSFTRDDSGNIVKYGQIPITWSES